MENRLTEMLRLLLSKDYSHPVGCPVNEDIKARVNLHKFPLIFY